MLTTILAAAFLRDGTIQYLPNLPGAQYSEPIRISDDGSTIVGFAFFPAPGPSRVVRWRAGHVEPLPLPDGFGLAMCRGVSANGNVVVGFGRDASDRERVLVWRDRDVTVLEPGVAEDVSGDGRRVIGYRTDGRFAGFLRLGADATAILHPSDATQSITPHAVSDDGSVVVGACRGKTVSDSDAFRWRRVTGRAEKLPTLGGGDAYAYDISADGRVIVGNETKDGGNRRPVLWNESGQPQELVPEATKAGWTLSSFGGGIRLDPSGTVAMLDGRTEDRRRIVYLWRRGKSAVRFDGLLREAPILKEMMDVTTLPNGWIVVIGSDENEKGFVATLKP